MEQPKITAGIWLAYAVVAAVLCLALARPLLQAWRCYERAASGERVLAEVVSKPPEAGVVLRVASGSQQGQVCTVKISKSFAAEIEAGDPVAVLTDASRPGECELADAVDASGALLWVIASGLCIILLLLALLASFAQRSFTVAPLLSSHLDVSAGHMQCPQCGKSMAEGYLPLLAGVHWRARGQPTGLPHALGGLPGTVGWRGRPRLHAYRCEACEVVTFRYGKAGR